MWGIQERNRRIKSFRWWRDGETFKEKEGEDLLNKTEKVALSMKKDKAKKKTTKEYWEEFKREMEELSPFEDEKVVKSSKKKKVTNKRKDLEE